MLSLNFQAPITLQDMKPIATDINAVAFLECSAKENIGVDEVFITAARAAMRSKKRVIPKFCVVL